MFSHQLGRSHAVHSHLSLLPLIMLPLPSLLLTLSYSKPKSRCGCVLGMVSVQAKRTQLPRAVHVAKLPDSPVLPSSQAPTCKVTVAA